MADDQDEEYLDEREAAERVGRKVLEMADRVRPMHAALPGAQAKWGFEVEDVRFEVIVQVSPRD